VAHGEHCHNRASRDTSRYRESGRGPDVNGYTSAMSESPTKDREKFLEAEKRRLYEEIRNYPTPIAGCDQQFNYLLEQQARTVAELNRIRASTEDR
jgi:hypothetical protein